VNGWSHSRKSGTWIAFERLEKGEAVSASVPALWGRIRPRIR
jgi:hypothetical protein